MFKNLGKITLASSSPRRLKLLEDFGFDQVKLVRPYIDEKKFLVKSSLKKSVKNIALNKALNVRKKIKNPFESTIISGDTIVFRAGKILHKADSKEKVKSYLSFLSSRKHKVYGGVCIISREGKIFSKVSVTEVFFNKLEESDFSSELLEEGIGKAGGYAIQGIASRFIKKIKGSYTNVVGLSTPEVYKIFKIL